MSKKVFFQYPILHQLDYMASWIWDLRHKEVSWHQQTIQDFHNFYNAAPCNCAPFISIKETDGKKKTES